jgi:pyruvate dehydrogenase E2 component (dihydrolipoamide acetyltransferase)
MSATSSLITVEVPDIGDFDEVPVIEILVAVGDTVAAEDPLVTLESDKATMDVPAPVAGTVRELLVSVGDQVAQGSKLMTIESSDRPGGDTAVEAPPAESPGAAVEREAVAQEITQPAESDAPTPSPASAPGNGSEPSGPIYASPSVRRLARELGISLVGVSGSGRRGRITKEDVAALERSGGTAVAPGGGSAPSAQGAGVSGLNLSPWPKVDFEKFGPVERVARTRIQKISAPTLARNWVMIPHVTHNDEADITELEAWRKELNSELSRDGVKITMVTFLVAASVATLKEFPEFNSSLDGEELVLRRYYNIGFAADTPGGLVVPVIKDADKKGLVEIARDLSELSEKGRAGKLGPGDMSGGTFTISSLGGIGGTSFTPIINAPEVAILGVTRAAMKPIWNGAEFVPRLMVPLSLSYDHRVIDGAAAARFVVHLVAVLSDLRRALL